MAVFHFSTITKPDHTDIPEKLLLRSESLYSLEMDKERKILTVITTGNLQPQQIEEWLKEEGFECSLIK